MTDEKFEYKSDVKYINYNGNNTGVCNMNGLKCAWKCEFIQFRNVCTGFRFSWNFDWDELKKKGIEKLSGYIILKPSNEFIYCNDFLDKRIDIDLKEPNQWIEKEIVTNFNYQDYRVIFEYSLIPHHAQIKQIAKPIILIIGEKKNIDANEKANSDEIVSTTEQNDVIPMKEEQKTDHINNEIHSDKLVPSSEQNDVILVNEKAKVQDNDEVNSNEMVLTTEQKKGIPEKVDDEKTHVNEKIHSDELVPFSEHNGNVPVKEEEEKVQDKEENLLSRLDKMFLSSEQNDAILVIDGKKIHVNKWFLSYHSLYFKRLLNDKNGQANEIPIEGISFDDFKLLFGPIFLKPVFPTDKTVEKLLKLATRFKMSSVIHHCEHHLLHHSKIENERMMWLGEYYGMSELLEKSIREVDTIEKAKKWKQTPEYKNILYETKGRVFDRLI